VAARFLVHARGSINIMKLVKMVYLLDRASIARRGVPVVGGAYLSMRNGPVTSELLDLINSGALWRCDTNWNQFISDRQDHEVALTGGPGADHLSQFELGLIAELFGEFEKSDQWELRDFCHVHCGEWLPLDKGAELISLSKLPEEVGREPQEVLENATEKNFLDQVFR
jgi:antitoxin SocA-like protein